MYSTSGNMIECMYFNKISVNFDGNFMCFGDRPTVTRRMTIIPNTLICLSALSKLVDCNTIVYDQVKID
jgi:hypothetical protein